MDEETWNYLYNPRRISIEALEIIEINKRGKGPDKKIYYSCNDQDGPYYDPLALHVHTWKSESKIKNFTTEQRPDVAHIQKRNYKPGLYCSICHIRNKRFKFTWSQIEEECKELPGDDYYSILEHLECKDEIIETKVEPNYTNWKKLMPKVLYKLYNKKTVYPISKYKSLLLWPWQMTPLQKMKLKIPDYKEQFSFIMKSNLDSFRENYAVIA